MNRLIPILILWGLLASVGVYKLYQAESAARTEVETLTQELKDSKAKLVLVQKKVSAAQAAAATARHKLKEALDAYPEFRDTAVPAPVYDSLCSTIRCN